MIRRLLLNYPLSYSPYLGRAPTREVKVNGVDRAPPREQVSETISQEQKLTELVEKAQDNLLSISTIFPFEFFPKKIVIDTTKVSVVSEEFLSSKHIQSFIIPNILEVIVETSLIFATLKILDFGSDAPTCVHYLNKKEAIKARRMIQGLVVAHKQGVDLSKIENKDLPAKIETLGEATLGE